MNNQYHVEPTSLPVDKVLISGELARRPSRPRDDAAQNRALAELAREVAEHPQTVLQKVVHSARELCNADSAIVTILEPDKVNPVFRWHAVAGAWAKYSQRTEPRYASPSGLAIDRDCTLLFHDPSQFFADARLEPLAHEMLLVPFRVGGEPVGTLWVIFHQRERHFDAEDERLITSLAHFAAAVYSLTVHQSTEPNVRTELSAALETIEGAAVTQHEQADELLGHTHERLQMAMNAGQIFSWQMNPVTRNLQWSNNMENVIGFPLLDNIDQTFELIHPNDRQPTIDAINRVLENGGQYESEYRLVNPANDETFWLRSQGAVMTDPRDGQLRLVGVTQNISERKRAEEATRASEQKFRSLFSSIDEGFYLAEVIWDEAGQAADIRYLDENPAAVSMIGQAAKGRLLSDLNPNYEQYWRAIFGHTARTGESQRLENYAAPDDKWFNFNVFKPEGVQDDSTFAVIFQDVSQRKRREENQAFLADLINEFTISATADDIMQSVGAKIGAYMKVVSVVFTDIDETLKQVTVSYGWVKSETLSIVGNSYSLEEYVTPEFERLSRANEPFVVSDTQSDQRTDAVLCAALQIRSCVVVPFHYNGEWRHCLTAYDSEPRNWRPDEIELFCELSNHILPHLERARAEEQLHRAAKRDAFLVQLADALRPLTDPARIQAEACRLLCEHLNVQRVNYADIEGDEYIIRCSHTRGVEPITGRGPIATYSHALLEEYRRHGGVAINDIASDSRFDERERANYARVDIAATASVMLIKDERWVASFAVHSSTRREWSAPELALVRETAERIWAFVERARAEEALRESEARNVADLAGMRRLYELQSKLADEHDLKAALQEVLAVACEFTSTDRGCVQMLSDDGQRLEMFVWQGYTNDSPFISFFRYEGLETGCEVARVQRQRLIIEETLGFPGLEGTAAGAVAQADGIRASQSTPMTSRAGETIGVVSTQFRQPHRPSEHELRLMDMLAWTASEFLERHRADAALRQSEERMRRALSIETVGVLFFSLDGRIHNANAAFQRMCGYTVEELRTTAHWEKLTAPEFIEPTRGTAQNLAERGEALPYVKMMIRPDGTRWWGLFAPTRLGGIGLDSECVEFIIDITQARATQEALRESEEKYRMLFNSIDEGYYLLELLLDEHGETADVRYLDANPAAIRMSGEDRRGKRLSEVGNYESYWFELYDRVARTGVSERTEQFSSAAGMWVDTYTFKVGEKANQVAIVFQDITPRKRREANLAFLAEITKNLSHLSTAEEIIETVGAKIGAFFNLSLCAFTYINEASDEATITHDWHRDEVQSLVGTYVMDEFLSGEFGRLSRAGESFIVRDTLEDARVDAEKYRALGVGAFVSSPIVRDGQWLFHIVMFDSKAHDWRPDEVELMSEITARIWTSIERARSEADLRHSEQRLSAMFEQAAVGLSEIGSDGRFLRVNDELCRIVGRSREEVLELSVLDVTHPEDQSQTTSAVQRAFEEHETVSLDKRYLRPDGALVWAHSVVTPLKDQQGKTLHFLAVTMDLTERKAAEEALRESEERLRIAVEAAEMGTWDWNLQTDEVRWNARHFELLGLEPQSDPVTSGFFFAHIHEEDRDMVRTKLLAAVEAKTTFHAWFRARIASGQVLWMEGYGRTGESDAEGKAVRMSGVMLDITGRKTAEAALSEREERLRFLVEGTRDYAMFLMDPQRRIFHWNSGAESLFGWSRDEMIGQSGDIIFTPEDRAKGDPEKEAEEAARTTSAPNMRWHRCKDGSLFWSDGRNTALHNEAGEVLGFSKILRDATNEKAADEALQRAHDELEERVQERTAQLRSEILQRRDAEHAREQLLQRLVNAQEEERRRISLEMHDEMGQQLTGLLLGLNALAKGNEPRIRTLPFPQQIQRLQEIARDVMQQMHHLAWELRPAALDTFGLEPALRRYVQQWSERSQVPVDYLSRGIVTADSPSSGLSSSRLPQQVETALYRVVQEALTNVQRHAQAGNVSVLLERREKDVIAMVEDDGGGFEVAEDETGRLRPSADRLGLLGMMERLELVNGILTVESAPGQGTTVYARVPIEPDIDRT
jgi:PAS domain S-box-containing protein